MTSAKRIRLEKGLMKVGEIAEEAGVMPSTVKFYTEEGLLDVVERTLGGYRLYDREKTVRRIIAIRGMTSRRLSLSELKPGQN
ncbi:MerR family DNA-binding transcriptional regulator [bacterium]|nr:MerR family DNA-binding transcriptional regulator [bacterium]MBU3955712.1 MerR family DNA-binding transcriptional regulator [bacterium]MBU4133953.1 MerR family DNA-binding transcriptional regulator [bacterium]